MEVIALIIITFTVVALQSVIFNKMAFKGLEYKCGFSVAEANEGDSIFLVETVTNRKMLPIPWLKADINTSRWIEFAGTRSVIAQDNRYVTSSFFLKSYQKTTRRWKLQCLKRGVFTIDTATLVAGDLLGVKSSSQPVMTDAKLVVYPSIVDLEEMFVPVNILHGDTIVKRWIIDDPFIISGIREYTPWDPMNRIHWGATARTGRLMVRQNDFTSQCGVTVVLNVQSIENEYFHAVDKDAIELGIKAAATIFDRTLRNGIPARLISNGAASNNPGQMIFTREASGRGHISELMGILARLELKRIRDFEDFIKENVSLMGDSDVIIVTAYLTPDICDTLGELKAKGNEVSVIILNKDMDLPHLPDNINIFVCRR